MIKKRFISMLVLLAAVATGARADQLASSYSSNATLNAVTVSASMEVTIATGVTVTINNGLNITSGTLTVKGPGTLVVNGKAGSNGYNNDDGDGGAGGTGGVAITGNIIVQGGATVKATGGNGGNGGNSEFDTGGNGAQGGAAITGEVTIQDASTLEATGGSGGKGGHGEGDPGNGGNGGNAFAGTLTYKGGTVTADGGNGGSGGSSDYGGNGGSGGAGKAFTTSVNFVSSDYILTDGSNAITATQVTSKKKVVINPKVAVNSVTLSPTSATLTLGETETVTLIPTVLPDDATDKSVTWSSSNEAVATVTDGVVTAVAAGTATITATATNGTADTSDDKTATCEVTVADPATKYDLTKADGSEAHGTVAFTVGGNAATQAKKDDVVTVSVTPDEGYSAKDVTVRGYTSWEAASEILAGGGDNPSLVSDINVTKNEENGTWSFTMPEANVWVVVTYTKNLQDAWIQAIADQTYTGSAITPTVTVMDGETTLVLNTDYTVAYSNNVETGTATVTVTGTGNYSGTATANFTIVADKSALNTAITEAETYYNSIKDDHAEAAAALKTAIDNAKAKQVKGDATQEEVNNALSALNTAKTTAEDAVLTETKTTLNNDITAAETYYNSIKDDHADAANTLKDAIDAAKAVKDNADATQAEVDAAIAALASAKTTAEQTVLTETKTALNDDITEAEAYYNSIKDSNPAAAATLLDAINAAKTVKDNADATQEQVDAAIAALASAKTTAEQTVLTETKTTLNNDITAAETYYNSIKDDHADAANDLKDAIDAAKAVKDNADATQAEVDAAIAALASAKTTAEQTVLTETKTALNDDITDAEAYYNSIKDSNPAAAATLLDAINAAKTVKDNGDATQEQVEAAIAALSTAINTAKVEVSRITLTIPAKSYMARIDADKRQIENAVAGVNLYSVQNVTNTEVVLTDELSVIAAEMPYFIYNDNDTEVEVSIIMSSEDADNVEYDSEHFKGTLVDKTFTAEDMQAADHYVLTNGSNFVWVKDAGTLSAGKCWIELEKSPANARALSIVFEDETTGISAVKTAATIEGNCYDLSGRKVAQPTKGLFIVNGKKVVIK